MSDIHALAKHATSIANDLTQALKVIDRKNNIISRQDTIKLAQQQLRQLYKIHHQLQSSLRTLDADQQNKNKAIYMYCQTLTNQINQFTKLLQQKRANSSSIVNSCKNDILQRDECSQNECLLSAHNRQKSITPVQTNKKTIVNNHNQHATIITSQAHKTFNDTIHSLNNTQRILGQTQQIGNQVVTTLQAQGQQIIYTNNTLQGMKNNLRRASDEVKAFLWRVTHDKIVIFFSIAILICLIAIAILVLVQHYIKQRKESNQGNQTKRC